MPGLLRWKRWQKTSNDTTGTQDVSMTSNIPNSTRQIGTKIHPDLDALLDQQDTPMELQSSSDDRITGKTATIDLDPDFVPLRPSARHHMANHIEDEEKSALDTPRNLSSIRLPMNDDKPVPAPEPSASLSLSSVSTVNTASNGTFGQSWRKVSRSRKGSKSSSTPASQETKDEWHGSSQKSTTPGSSSDYSRRQFTPQSSVSIQSRNTFGIPSPSSGALSSNPETIPPLPPLNHPAFQSALNQRPTRAQSQKQYNFAAASLPSDDDKRVPRPSHSLPSLSARRRVSPIALRRARTHSQTKMVNSSLDPNSPPDSHSTPLRSRLQRSKSEGSGRRASAEFSAMQAYSAGSKSESWEAIVSREMVEMSLKGSHEALDRTLRQRIAEEPTALGKTRGDHSNNTPALGSPFLFQSASPYHKPLRFTPSDNFTRRSNLVNHQPSRGKSIKVSMSQETSIQVASTSSRTRTPSPRPILPPLASAVSSSSLLAPPALSLTAPTPQPSPISPPRPHHQKAATDPTTSILRVPQTPPVARASSGSSTKGKRKADEAGVEGGNTPPKDTQRATFALEPRPHRVSGNSSTAPSSYHRKRARLSSTTYELRSASAILVENSPSRPQNARTTGSWSSRTSSRAQSHRPPHSSNPPLERASSRRSFSQVSIPVSALISPHAPSIGTSSSFHMRDPNKPSPIQSTPWSLTLPSGQSEPGEGWKGWVERGGSPLHAWLFFLGFLFFPVWWVASFTNIPKTRTLGQSDREKGVLLDDPQVEHDAKSWRKRCRVMAIVSFFTYIPFIILVAIFAS